MEYISIYMYIYALFVYLCILVVVMVLEKYWGRPLPLLLLRLLLHCSVNAVGVRNLITSSDDYKATTATQKAQKKNNTKATTKNSSRWAKEKIQKQIKNNKNKNKNKTRLSFSASFSFKLHEFGLKPHSHTAPRRVCVCLFLYKIIPYTYIDFSSVWNGVQWPRAGTGLH